MSQASTIIVNQPFPTFRSSLNSALDALLTNHSGSLEPAAPTENQLWIDTSVSPYLIKIRAAAAWITIGRAMTDAGFIKIDDPRPITEPLVTGTAIAFGSLADGRTPTKGAIAAYYNSAPSVFVPTFINSWTIPAGAALGYYRLAGIKVIHLVGLVQRNNPTAGSVMFNLPAGFRPPVATAALCGSTNPGGFAQILIEVNGDVSWASANTTGTIITNLNLMFLAT